jgi:hypothetical protein
MYEDAIDAFRAAQKIDPSFAMAYWGEALSFSQPLWFFEEVDKAKAALAKLDPTPEGESQRPGRRESRASCAPLKHCSGPATGTPAPRAYATAMAKVAAENPADDEAQLFYALALLGTMPRGDAALPIRQQAGAIAEKVFARNPNHPVPRTTSSTPTITARWRPRALPAARAYAKIAPGASHALHMPAHAFLQMGMWDEAAVSDEASWNASIAWAKRRGLPITSRDFHSLAWLQYEWTQQGRFSKTKDAIASVDEALKAPGTQDPGPKTTACRRPWLW